jgi:tripartite-type tricarboxylate transporter receptor subunit TctC
MRANIRAWLLTLVFPVALLTGPAFGAATGYPQRPVKIIVPYAAGGASDLSARFVGQALARIWQQSVVIENRPGANTMIGSEAVASAANDGYTLLWTSNAHVINPALYPKMPYDWRKDFVSITQVALIPQVVVTHPSFSAQTFTDLIKLAKSKPDSVTFGSSGTGGPGHLAGALLNDIAGIKLLHVPYKGAGPAMNDLLGGHIALMFNGIPATLPQISAGKLVPLAMASKDRSPLLPNVPTVAELGYPSYEASTWVALFAPSGTPLDVVDKIQRDVAAALKSKEMINWLREQGLQPVGSTPSAFQMSLNEEAARWQNVIQKAGIKGD